MSRGLHWNAEKRSLRSLTVSARAEIEGGDRFGFGANWKRYAQGIDDGAVEQAKASLIDMLGRDDLAGLRFLDIGSGSGLFSLAAHLLGADVVSFDFDEDSVECTDALRLSRGDSSREWRVLQGSVLDDDFMASLGQFDVVYSWGVLHHTGEMWRAMDNAARAVCVEGTLFIAVYNDQGAASRLWAKVKHRYVSGGSLTKRALIWAVWLRLEVQRLLVAVVRPLLRLPRSAPRVSARGMSRATDLVDWVGGWPFEVARPEDVFSFLKERGFALERLVTKAGGYGCNEYVLGRVQDPTSSG